MIKSHTILRSSVLAIAITLALGSLTGVANAEDTVTQNMTDVRQETQIWTTYALSPYLRANDLRVSVQNGKATLTGTVDDGVTKDLATQIALGVDGIKDADFVPPAQSTTRSYGEAIDDASITAAIKAKLLWSKYASGLTTSVETKAGRVSLSGTATSKQAKEAAQNLAMNTQGVLSVNNQIKVEAPKPSLGDKAKSALSDAGTAISDAWITTKVNSTFLYSSNVHSGAISVATKDGVVKLTGKTQTGAERALAIELAQNVQGVKRVDAKALTHN
ncbi:MAG: transporter [Halothiobacillus sp. 14-55-98]|jgi:osmotically-inducible protein OsmY|nr:MAG: transporter [Halothiobacillus sp. 14-55-98]